MMIFFHSPSYTASFKHNPHRCTSLTNFLVISGILPYFKLKSTESEKQNKIIVTYRLNIWRSAKQNFVYGGHENWFKKIACVNLPKNLKTQQIETQFFWIDFHWIVTEHMKKTELKAQRLNKPLQNLKITTV